MEKTTLHEGFCISINAMKPLRRYMHRTFERAVEQNLANILGLIERDPNAVLLDCGCDDGALTRRFAAKAETTKVHGIEINPAGIAGAAGNGINAEPADLNGRLPFDDGSFDVVSANQIIEHLHNTEMFLDEIYRVLKKGGYALISTENLASWHNIAALLMGWQPFSLTNVSARYLGIGNPLALHRGKSISHEAWQHLRVFSFRGLKELFELKGFRVEKLLGAGYFPLPGFFAAVDPRHAAFLTAKIRKA
ncbi:MAG: class I SAM-dependent methyltransferase [Deltaproteobacteria bacterium]|nr:class I SAM-dependent methyltransferase [Deltaproteobacteria bacterium]MBZ0219543.1 class I SAM-dependent methyltransferase [Deltaproteobacteria bacterium]